MSNDIALAITVILAMVMGIWNAVEIRDLQKDVNHIKQTITSQGQFPVGKLQKTSYVSKLLTKSNQYTIVEFTASWCGACKTQKPITEKLRSSGVNIVYINADKQRSYKGIKINALPTIFIEKNGNIINKFVGVTSLETLKGAMNL